MKLLLSFGVSVEKAWMELDMLRNGKRIVWNFRWVLGGVKHGRKN